MAIDAGLGVSVLRSIPPEFWIGIAKGECTAASFGTSPGGLLGTL